MSLNCRPGDLAIVLPPRGGGSCAATGLIVTVLRRLRRDDVLYESKWLTVLADEAFDAGVEWLIRLPRALTELCNHGLPYTSDVNSMWDARLRPITPPPNTATDEEVRELYRPRTVTPCKHKQRGRV